MQCTGYVACMSDDRWPKQLFYNQLHANKCLRHKSWKRYNDNLKKMRVNIKVDIDNWEKLALRRTDKRIHVGGGCPPVLSEHTEHVNLHYSQLHPNKGLRHKS